MTEDGAAAASQATSSPPTIDGRPVDPEPLDPQQLARLVEDLDAKELEGLLGGLDAEVLGTLVRAAGPETAKRLLRKVGAGAFDITAIDPASVDPEIFDTELMALLFKLTPDAKLAAAMESPLRDVVVTEVFRRMPERVDARAAAATNATIAWRIARPGGGFDSYLVTIADGRCEVSQEMIAE